MLVLATTGRRTGEPRRTCLIQGTGGDDNPDWFMNLRANPSAGVQVGPRRFTARARIATDTERARLWPMMASIFPLYDE